MNLILVIFHLHSFPHLPGWTRDSDRKFDIAVVRYWPKNGVNIGERLGYAGLRRTNSYSMSKTLTTATGYPGDKGGQEMWTSYCYDPGDFTYQWATFLVAHWCDVWGGNSGSSFLDANTWVNGIHVAHYTNGSANLAVLLYGYHFDNVLRWAGR